MDVGNSGTDPRLLLGRKMRLIATLLEAPEKFHSEGWGEFDQTFDYPAFSPMSIAAINLMRLWEVIAGALDDAKRLTGSQSSQDAHAVLTLARNHFWVPCGLNPDDGIPKGVLVDRYKFHPTETDDETVIRTVDELASMCLLPLRRVGAKLESEAELSKRPAAYLGVRIDSEKRTITRDGYDVVPIVLSPLKWQALRLLHAANGSEVPLDRFAPPEYGGERSALRQLLAELSSDLGPLDLSASARRLRCVRKN